MSSTHRSAHAPQATGWELLAQSDIQGGSGSRVAANSEPASLKPPSISVAVLTKEMVRRSLGWGNAFYDISRQ